MLVVQKAFILRKRVIIRNFLPNSSIIEVEVFIFDKGGDVL